MKKKQYKSYNKSYNKKNWYPDKYKLKIICKYCENVLYYSYSIRHLKKCIICGTYDSHGIEKIVID